MTPRRVLGAVAGAALMIAAVTALSRLVGFVRILVFSKTVGDTCLGDVYNTANLLPNVAFEIVAGGALASVVVPVLVGWFDRGDREGAAHILSALLTWTLGALVPIALLLALFAEPLMRVFLGGSAECGEAAVEVGARMLRVFAPQVPMYGLAVVVGGALQARRSYLPSSAAPIVGSLVVIPAYLLFATMESGQTPLDDLDRTAELVLSVGTTLGVVGLTLATVLPALRKDYRLPYRPTLHFPAGVAARARALALAGLAVFVAQQLSTVVVAWLANHQGPSGTFTLYTWAWALYLLPYAVLAVPLATSAFQRLSSEIAAGDDSGYRSTSARTTRAIVLAGAAGACALAAAAVPIARAFVLGPGSGNPTPLATGLIAFAPGLVGYALVAHLGRALYARHRGRDAAIATTVGWAAVVVIDVVLVGRVEPGQVVGALGVGNTVGMTIAGGLLVVAVVRSAGRAAMAGVGRTAIVATLGGVVAGLAGYQIGQLFGASTFVGAVAGAVAAASVSLLLLAAAVLVGDRSTVSLLRLR